MCFMSAYIFNNCYYRGSKTPKRSSEKDVYPAPNSFHLSGLVKGRNALLYLNLNF